MNKKLEKVNKEKIESVNQLKSLFVLFTQQRKALEVSINKTKRLEEENQSVMTKNRNLEDQQKLFAKKIEQLEQDKEVLLGKHRKDRETLELELDEKK